MEKLKQAFKDINLTAAVLHRDSKMNKNERSDKMTKRLLEVISCENVLPVGEFILEFISDW